MNQNKTLLDFFPSRNNVKNKTLKSSTKRSIDNNHDEIQDDGNRWEVSLSSLAKKRKQYRNKVEERESNYFVKASSLISLDTSNKSRVKEEIEKLENLDDIISSDNEDVSLKGNKSDKSNENEEVKPKTKNDLILVGKKEVEKSGYGVLLSALKDRSIMNTQMRNRKRILLHRSSSYHSRTVEHVIQKYSLSHFHASQSVQLDRGTISNRLSLCDLTSLVFDSKGVLLAVSSPRYGVRIYDFDELMALDLKARNSYRADETDKPNIPKQRLRPMIQIPMSKVVSCLEWNPDNEDQIAVAFQGHNDVDIHDLNTIVAARKKSNRQPSPCYRFVNKLFSTHEMEGTKSLLFLRKSQVTNKKQNTCLLVGSVSGTIRMWTLPTKRADKPTCLWRYRIFTSSNTLNSEAVSVMKLVTAANSTGLLLLVGGSRGSFVMVDIAKQSRTLFTNTISPTLLRRWNVSSIINRQYQNILLHDNMCHIKNVCVWQEQIKKLKPVGEMTDEAVLNLLQESFLSIVISNGWVLNLRFTSCQHLVDLDISMDAMYIAPTPQQTDPDKESTPDIPSHASQMTNSHLLCISKTLHVNQSHLLFVDVKQNNFKFDGEDVKCKQMQCMKSAVVGRNVSNVVVHPCDEWIVTVGGDGDELELISLRCKREIPSV